MTPAALIIIPAHDEAGYIDACLSALLATNTGGRHGAAVTIVVVANACTDLTADLARQHTATATARGWTLRVIECDRPGKLHALNLAERGAPDTVRVYLDADVTVSPDLIPQLISALDRTAPAYASGTPLVAPPRSALLRAYSRFWARLPFVTRDVPGFGVFAVNAAARQRWGLFPDIISDDTFVRLHFSPQERIKVPATYSWPMVEGFANLVRVRRRQDMGVTEIARLFPALTRNCAATRLGPADLAYRFLRDPVGFLAYSLVSVAVRLPIAVSRQRWARGR